MSTNWQNVTLSNHVEVTTGFPFRSARFLNGGEGTIKLLRGDNVGQGLLRWDGAKHWPGQNAQEYAPFFLAKGDVILAMDRPWIEAGLKYAWVRQSDLPCLLVQRVARLRGCNGLSTEYLRYVIGSPAFTAHVKSITTGVNVPHISGKDIKRFSFPLPSPQEQECIASILGAYDDLIEVNRRRIALLEEMAWRLFEEWFVRFRFPGHEDTAITETPDGPLPKGWHRARLDQVANVNCNTIGPRNAPTVIGYVDISCVLRGEVQKVDRMNFADAPGRARRKVRDGSIIWSTVRPNRRSYALIHDPSEDLIVSTGFAVLDAHSISASYLYHHTTTEDFVGYLVGNATGAAYPAVTGGVFERATLVVPTREVDQQFNSIAGPALRTVSSLRKQNNRLASSRDLLLPRLISGELSVSSAERELEMVT